MLTWDDVPALMGELRQIALALLQGEGELSLCPTALINSALRRQRLSGQEWGEVCWANRAYFFGAMRRAMQRAYLDHARKRGRRRRHLGQRISLDALTLDPRRSSAQHYEEEMAALQHAFAMLEENFPPELVSIAHHRVFLGLTYDEIAALMELSPSDVGRSWRFARCYLHRQMLHFLEM